MEAGHRTRTIGTRGVASGRTTRRRWATAGAAALLTILMAGAGIANAQTVIWEATLTVEDLGNIKGYSMTRGLGSLSNPTFKYKGRTLTVNTVATSSLEGTNRGSRSMHAHRRRTSTSLGLIAVVYLVVGAVSTIDRIPEVGELHAQSSWRGLVVAPE